MSEPLVENEQRRDSWTHAKPPRDAIFMSAVTLRRCEPRSSSMLLLIYFFFSNIWLHASVARTLSSG